MKVFEPISIGNVQLKNRFAHAPSVVRFHAHDGYMTERYIGYIERIAQGGAGLVTCSATFINPDGRIGSRGRLSMMHHDGLIPGWKKVTEAAHAAGAKISIQLAHFGKAAGSEELPWSPTGGIPAMMRTGPWREYTEESIDDTLEDWGRAARRVMLAGFDFVTIHGAHCLQVEQFMSPLCNRRTDRWGDKTFFPTEVIKRIRKYTHPDFPIIYRISGDEFHQDAGLPGYTLDDLQDLLPPLVEAGAAAIDISAGSTQAAGGWIVQSRYWPKKCLMPLARAAKAAVSVPVIGVGRLNHPDEITQVVEEGDCDIVAFSRTMFAEPDLPKKMIEGRYDEIRRCIYCDWCIANFAVRPDMGCECAVNVQFGWEREGLFGINPVPKEISKKVLIAGGGAAGMEAARILAERGHTPVIYEASGELGGQVPSGAVPPAKKDFMNIATYLQTMMKKLNVPIVYNTKVTPEIIQKEQPVALIIATGSTPTKPPIPGIDGPNVVMAIDLLLGKAQSKGQKVAIIGGELVGTEVADMLSGGMEPPDPDTFLDPQKRNPSTGTGQKVTIMRRGEQFATHVVGSNRFNLLRRLQERGVVFLGGIQRYKEINSKGVVIVDKEGQERLIEADTVVIAAGSRPNGDDLAQQVRGKGLLPGRIYVVGDAVKSGLMYDAIITAARAACDI
ncbi:MAG: FAD-dependent oxidoreductase [Chloroflexi bacterium]|nr:FAD-dependent oxidoreductase [Chloroflexota bacterium]